MLTTDFGLQAQQGQIGYLQEQHNAFDSAVRWREYAGYLETKLTKAGIVIEHIANDVQRTTAPRRVTGYE